MQRTGDGFKCGDVDAQAARKFSNGASTHLLKAAGNYDGSKSRIMIPVVSWAMSGDFAWITEPGTAAELSFTGTVMMAQGLNDPAFGDFMRIDALPA